VPPPPGGVLPPPVPGGPVAPSPPPAAAAKRGIFGTGIDVSMANTFIEAASIFRTRNETADIASDFNTGIPMPNNPNYHLSEFRESAHQSRLALQARASVNEFTKLGGTFETDFQSAGVSANSTESNSYGLRLRLAYATLDKRDWGHLSLAGSPGAFSRCSRRT
jgi:predicted porin